MLAISILTGVGALLVWGFVEGRDEAALEAEREQPVKEPLRVRTSNGQTIVTVDAETQQRSGIETTALKAAPYQDERRAYATVLDPARLTELGNNYANAKAQLVTAQAKAAASKAAFERTQALYKDQQNVSLAQLQTIEATFRTDQAAVAAAESAVRTLSATTRQEWGPVLGQSIIDGSPLAVGIIERQSFLLQVTLPPGVAAPDAPPSAWIETATPERAAIRLVSASPRTDPRIQGLSFFYVTASDAGVLPGMNVTAFLPSGTKVVGIVVPHAAIVWSQDRAWAYRRLGPDRFARILIATDAPAGGGYLARDLPDSAEIVTDGAQLLLSEEFRAQIRVGGD
jgi:hypothetical protein